ncbi:Methyltransferase type 11 [Ascosphaera apis ARSEF 7405]|uniref:Methyltransferase type 11 n=1 Tax=Ascosphaera apis ARSEF 7405 TaxID=392613 RepID=A0A168A834_9EURO|nr:Methyltransferase type 11 [Ascosphaera apis ARSEF 7405]
MAFKQVYTTDHSTNVIRTHGWRTIANSAAYVLPVLRPDMKILDVGCGPGSITIDFAQRCPQGHVIGVEYIEDPLPGARAGAEAAGLKNIEFQVGDVHDLPFPDDTFDLVHVHQVLQHVDDPVHALKEMRRVCKPGGIVAARESDALSWYPDSEGIALWAATDKKMRADKGGDPHCGRKIHVFAKQAGFELDKIKRSAGSWCFSTREEREYWGGSMGARAQSSGFAETAVKDGYLTKEQVTKIVDGWREFVEDENAWFGLMNGEILCTK